MKTNIINPETGIYPPTADYAHAIEVIEAKRTLYISGTMGLEQDGAAGKDLNRQLDLIWSNISAILRAAQMNVDNIIRITSYLRDASYAKANQDARVTALKGRTVPTTAIVVETLSGDWLVELEVIAAE
ncbi:MAG: RidA family protein [Sneathiellales bacterium]|nr:RidA family protein [Sneathiellales bacterium]